MPRRTTGHPDPVIAPEPPTSDQPAARADEQPVGSVQLDANGNAGDPLLRMVRAAVGRAVEASSPEGLDREASAS